MRINTAGQPILITQFEKIFWFRGRFCAEIRNTFAFHVNFHNLLKNDRRSGPSTRIPTFWETLPSMYFHLRFPARFWVMFLLLVALIANDRLASWVRPISLVLISYLAVLFVPAGVGIMLHIDRLKNEALPIGVSLVVSTILTIAVTALVIKYSTIWLQKRKEQKGASHE